MSKKDSFWIPYADLMTVLMVIFLFISIAYMGLVQYKQQQQDKIFEEYKQTKENLYNELKETFKNDFQKWNLALDQDLSIRFTNPNVLFEPDKAKIRPLFEQILNEFIPKYFNVLRQVKYQNKIAEIRIEGHSDPAARTPTGYQNENFGYIENLQLSQDRSLSVMDYIIRSTYYNQLPATDKKWIRFSVTATGLSYGRTLDNEKKYSYKTGKDINFEYSRRVEFRIVTTSELLVEKVIQQMQNK
jgi:outer membrane protein OmpA-like peptidoglycan-associated protein